MSLTWPFRRVGVSRLYFGRRLEAEIKEEPISELARKRRTKKFIKLRNLDKDEFLGGWESGLKKKKGFSSFDL